MSASPPPAVAPDAIFDAVVVGGGPGGLSAALWLARYRRKALLVDAGEHRNRWTEQAHGYLGSDPVDPAVLLGRARSQLGRYDTAACVQDSVTAIRRSAGDGFTVELTGGTPVAARRIVLATGVRDEFPAVEGFFDHYGASVFHCPSCDGYEARDRRVVVLGWGAQITGFALELLDWAATVTVVTDRESLAAAPPTGAPCSIAASRSSRTGRPGSSAPAVRSRPSRWPAAPDCPATWRSSPSTTRR